jgi:hypothetical protein
LSVSRQISPRQVFFRGEVEVHLDRAGPVHHVEALCADLRHIAAHDVIAGFRHARRVGQRPFRRAADAEKADAQRLGDLAQVGQMPIGFLAGLVQVFERRAGKFELSARLQRDRALSGMFGKPDDIAGVDDRLPAAFCRHAVQQRRDAGLAEIGNRAVVRLEEGELIILRTNAEPVLRRVSLGQIFGQVSKRGDRCLVGGISGHGRLLLNGSARGKTGHEEGA